MEVKGNFHFDTPIFILAFYRNLLPFIHKTYNNNFAIQSEYCNFADDRQKTNILYNNIITLWQRKHY